MPRPVDPYRVELTTSDGVVLVGSWRPVADRGTAPAVLLLHDFSRERREWEPWAAELNAKGFATLAIDLRAHGESTRQLGAAAAIHLSPSLQKNRNGFPRDVEAACRWLRARAPSVAVLGVSLGGNLAVLATGSKWADAAVAVSPNIARLSDLAGSLPRSPNATLVLASESDPGRAASAKVLMESGQEPKRMLVFDGAAHNFGLLNLPEAHDAAMSWLTERLGKPAAPEAVNPAKSAPSAAGAESGNPGSTRAQ